MFSRLKTTSFFLVLVATTLSSVESNKNETNTTETNETVIDWDLLISQYGPQYNFVIPKASCYDEGLCDHAIPGTIDGSFPNAQEKALFLHYNIARLFPAEFADSPIGTRFDGTPVAYWDDETTADVVECGSPQDKPFWLSQDAAEAARFRAYTCSTCLEGCTGHDTCPSLCGLFGDDCGFGPRTNAFEGRNEPFPNYLRAEGICYGLGCFRDAHCKAIFRPDDEMFGLGFANDGTQETHTLVYSHGPAYPPDYYPIPIATHYNLEYTEHASSQLTPDDYLFNASQPLGFSGIFYSETEQVSGAFVAYQGELHELELLYTRGANSVYDMTTSLPDSCEPYFFLFQTNNGTKEYRLPQDSRYYFGIQQPQFEWNQDEEAAAADGKEYFRCEENHYYDNGGGEIVLHGGPGIPGIDDFECVGCAKVEAIQQFNPRGVGDEPATATGSLPTKAKTQQLNLRQNVLGGCTTCGTVGDPGTTDAPSEGGTENSTSTMVPSEDVTGNWTMDGNWTMFPSDDGNWTSNYTNATMVPSEGSNSNSSANTCTIERPDGEVRTFSEGESLGDFISHVCGPDFPCICNPAIPGQFECPFCRFDTEDGDVVCASDGETTSFVNLDGVGQTCVCEVPEDSIISEPAATCVDQ